jgi:hypothetical protein
MKPLICLAGIAALLLAGAALAAPGADKPDARPAWEQYQVLAERNMFSKNRRIDRPEVRRERPPAPDPERSVVLTGVVCRDGEYVAFLEDFRTNTTITAGIGDSVVRGRLASITLDNVDYERAGQTVRVSVGSNFEGGGSSSVSSAGADTSGTPEGPAAGGGDLVERMRQARLRDLGQ